MTISPHIVYHTCFYNKEPLKRQAWYTELLIQVFALISTKRFMLPERIRGDLYLSRLTTIQGITRWPSKLLILEINRALPQKEKEELEKRYPGKVHYG